MCCGSRTPSAANSTNSAMNENDRNMVDLVSIKDLLDKRLDRLEEKIVYRGKAFLVSGRTLRLWKVKCMTFNKVKIILRIGSIMLKLSLMKNRQTTTIKLVPIILQIA